MANRIGVLLVGRNSIVREGLSRILKDHDFRVLQSVGTVPELCRPVRDAEHQVDLIVIDPIAWNTDAVALSEVKERFPSARIVALLDKFEFSDVVSALRAGAHGLVVTDICCAGLIESLRLAAMGERVLPSSLADMLPSLVNEIQWQPDPSVGRTNLSDREIEILRCLIMGCPNTLISRRLSISEAAVKVHVKAVLRKIPVKNRTQAAIWAVKRGITAFDRSEGLAPAREETPAPALFSAPAAPRVEAALLSA